MRDVVAAREASTFDYSIHHPLHVMEVWSHDTNVAVAMEVARQASRIDFQLEHSTKGS